MTTKQLTQTQQNSRGMSFPAPQLDPAHMLVESSGKHMIFIDHDGIIKEGLDV